MSYALTSTRYCIRINFHPYYPVKVFRFVDLLDLSEEVKEPRSQWDNNFKGSA